MDVEAMTAAFIAAACFFAFVFGIRQGMAL